MEFRKPVRSTRTRYLLPMEMLLYSIIALVALLAILPGGILQAALELTGWTHQWLLGFGIVGIAGLSLSSAEWMFGWGWDDRRIERLCYWRGMVAISAVALGVICARAGAKMGLLFLFGIGMYLLLFALWYWWGNRRAYHLLSERFDTRECEDRMTHQRAYF